MVRGFLSITLLAALMLSVSGQEEPKPLQVNPAEDLFTLAAISYQEAVATEDQEQRRGYFETALRQFARLREQFPQHPRLAESWYYSAVCQDNLDQPDMARECLRKVVSVSKKGALAGTAAAQLGALEYQAGNFAEAAPAFLIASREHEDESTRHTALYQRALCFQKLGKEEALAPALEEVLADEGSPFHQQARQALAHLFRKQDKKEPALEQFRLLLESEDAQVRSRALLNAALLARDLAQKEETQALFRRILDTAELKKWHGEAQLYLMSLAAQAGQPAEVTALFERGRFDLPADKSAKRLLLAIRAYESSSEDGDTTPLYRELVRVAPEKKTVYEASYVLLTRGFGGADAKALARDARRFVKDHARAEYADARVESVRLMLAETEYGQENWGAAADAYAAIDLSALDESNHAGVRFHLSTALRKAGRDEAADTALVEFLKHHPDDPRVAPSLVQRADRALSRSDFDAALADYETALDISSDAKLIEYAWVKKATIFKEQEALPELKAAHEFLLATFPDREATATASSFFWIGWTQFRLDEIAESISSFERARKADAQSFSKEATVHMALARYGLEQLEELQSEVDRLDRDHPGTLLPRPVYAWLGTQLAGKGDYQAAWSYLPRAIAGDPAEVATGVRLAHAEAAFATGHFDEATTSYSDLLAEEENAFRQAEYHYHLARCWRARKNPGNATAQAEDALALKPQGELNGSIRLLLGTLAEESGDPETAMQHYVVVAELFGENAETRTEALRRAIAILEERGTPEDLARAENYRNQLDSP